MSDSLGDLLFYSDGTRVWGKNHEVMPNGEGLLGGASSTHACLAVPHPGSSELYYLFTLDDFCDNLQNGLRYSIIDLCSREGGEVAVEQKNILLLDTASEKMALVRHGNGVDFWLVVQKYFSNAFYSYPITESGVGEPILSMAGAVHEPLPSVSEYVTAIGQMKVSPSGNKLAVAAGNGAGLLQVFHFDNHSGALDLLYDLSPALPFSSGYGGVSFSPDGNRLYVTLHHFYQFDLAAGSEADIRQSIVQLSPLGGNITFRGLQVGPDGRIYVARGSNRLSVVESPDLVGVSCNYQHDVVDLGQGYCEYSFPTFMDSFGYTSSGFCDTLTSISETDKLGASLALDPNPATHTVRVEVSGSRLSEAKSRQFGIQSVVLTDMLGHTVLSLPSGVVGEAELDVSGLSAGVYTVAATLQNGEMLRQRLVVQR